MERRLVAISILLVAASARANPDDLVPSVSPPGSASGIPQPTNIFATITYDYETDRADIYREHVGPGVSPDGGVPLRRDLVYQGSSHTITPRIDVGVLRDTWITVALPIVIAESSELHFDSGVDAGSSSTVADGLLPRGGYDAQDPSTPPMGDLAFRGIGRHGLDQLYLGIGVAPMNQARDDTKPTWKIGAEARIAIGSVMKFDPSAPGANTAVGEGVHELRLWTTFDRRIGWAEPWVELSWLVPLASTSSSLFQNPGFGSTNVDKSQQAEAAFGLEAYLLDTPDNRVSLDLGARATAHFEGRGYSELWQVFALAGNPTLGGPLVLDADPTQPGMQAMAYPGISNLENYLETAAQVAIRGELGPHVRFAVLGDAVWRTDHVISFADAGVDRNMNDLVEPGTAEVNPLHVDTIDLVGHRYHSIHDFGVVVGVQGQVLF